MEDENTNECCICLDINNMDNDNTIYIINNESKDGDICNCNINLHSSCFFMWFRKHLSCPICRNTIPQESIYFNNNNDFYSTFLKQINENHNTILDKNKKQINETKIKFPFYSIEDIKFRLVRDTLLTKNDYENTMTLMMSEKKFIAKEFYSKLFFNKDDLKTLDNLGHIVGLHSHSHPTLLEKLTYEEQKKEYEKSISVISRITNKSTSSIKCMSHPCGSYNKDTLEILNKMDIRLGFKQIMSVESEKGMKKINNSHLEIARQDHVEIIKRINYEKL